MDLIKLLFGTLLLLFIFVKHGYSGKTKKTIKIHVPYYIKHIHHYKKVYVPKVQVIKHEHLYKKEHDHHHHHHHGHGGYSKNDEGGHYDDYDGPYDDVDYARRLPKRVPYKGEVDAYSKNWRSGEDPDEDASESGETYVDDDYSSDQEEQREFSPAPHLTVPKYTALRPSRQSSSKRIRPKSSYQQLHSYPVRKILVTT